MHELRPQLEVLAVEPPELDRVVARLAPAVVICSRLSELVETHVPAWVVLYPGGDDRATICVAGRQTRLAPVAFDRILALIAQAVRPGPAIPLVT